MPRFEAHFTPAVEVGWRLARDAWGFGYASEAARAAVAVGFDEVGFDEIVSFTATGNVRSMRVMERIGMTHDPADDFDHPALAEGSPLRRHVLYRIARPTAVPDRGSPGLAVRTDNCSRAPAAVVRSGADRVRRRQEHPCGGGEAAGSSTWHSSRAECIESSGVPTSSVRMPSRVAVIGPIVDPHGTALFDTNGCQGTSAAAQIPVQRAVPAASVV